MGFGARCRGAKCNLYKLILKLDLHPIEDLQGAAQSNPVEEQNYPAKENQWHKINLTPQLIFYSE